MVVHSQGQAGKQLASTHLLSLLFVLLLLLLLGSLAPGTRDTVGTPHVPYHQHTALQLAPNPIATARAARVCWHRCCCTHTSSRLRRRRRNWRRSCNTHWTSEGRYVVDTRAHAVSPQMRSHSRLRCLLVGVALGWSISDGASDRG